MTESLSGDELATLIESVFALRSEDRALAILVDLPDDELQDRQPWAERRTMAGQWRDRLLPFQDRLGMKVRLFQYPNAGANNADLPAAVWPVAPGSEPLANADALTPSTSIPMATVFEDHDVILAPTELSATAPLKVAARRWGFRAATMPGFSPEMVPALRLDYEEVHRRCMILKALLDRSQAARLTFRVGDTVYSLYLDLRHRRATASGGLVRDSGQAGNLPSGETYIVPYEGEIAGDSSRSSGQLPVELDGALLVYRIEENQAVSVAPYDAAASQRASEEAAYLAREPAYGNLAELGLGVLGDWGLQPIGSVLLDEKLGLHIAFGRSEHFGGQVGPDDFTSPRAVVHIDRVYLPATQPRIIVESVDLDLNSDLDPDPDSDPGSDPLTRNASSVPLMRDGRYVVDLTSDGQADPRP